MNTTSTIKVMTAEERRRHILTASNYRQYARSELASAKEPWKSYESICVHRANAAEYNSIADALDAFDKAAAEAAAAPVSVIYDYDLLSDLHKEAFGFRPNHFYLEDFRRMTEAEKQGEWSYLIATAERRVDERRAEQDRNAVKFEQQVAELTNAGCTRVEALRILVSTVRGAEHDINFAEYKFGLRFGYIERELRDPTKPTVFGF